MMIMTRLRNEIVNMDTVGGLFIERCMDGRWAIFARWMGGFNVILGVYKNEERAYEVFGIIFEKWGEEKRCRVYEMPKD